jgi:hypothetical protein
MMSQEVLWRFVWRTIAFTLAESGYFPLREMEEAAEQRQWPMKMVMRVADTLNVESFEWQGEQYWRLSDKVVPLVPPRLIARNVATGGAA